MIKYSVIVCSYNGSGSIAECLDSLVGQSVPRDSYEVIVVDDGSTDGLVGLAKKYVNAYGNMRLISHPSNRGLSAARNTGWRSAKGEIIFYIDDDAVADHNWIERLAAYYTSPDIAGVGGYPRPYFENSVYTLYDIAKCRMEYGINAEKLNDTNSGAGGCNMSLRRAVLEEVGGFDVRFRAVADDADINRRIAEKGYRLLTVADITVRHRYPRSLSEFVRKKAGRGRGELVFDRKYTDKNILLRTSAGLVLAVFNVPKSILAGLRLSKISGRYGRFPIFSILYSLERISVKYGKLNSLITSKA